MFKNKIKAVVFVVIVIFFIYQTVNWVITHRMGYFVRGENFKYRHPPSITNLVKMDDGNVLVVGNNTEHEGYFPGELYNVKTNAITDVAFPRQIYYRGIGIILENNRILLPFAYDPSKPEYKNKTAYPYDCMAIVDLNNAKVEKLLKKKIANEEQYITKAIHHIPLFDKYKVILFDLNKDRMEVYDTKNECSRIINLPPEMRRNLIRAIPVEENRILIFCSRGADKSTETDIVWEYNDTTKAIKKVGKRKKGDIIAIAKINPEEIAILNYRGISKDKTRIINEIEIYNIKHNTSKTIASLTTNFNYDLPGREYNGARYGDNHFVVAGGRCEMGKVLGYKDGQTMRKSEIVDLKTYKTYVGPKTAHYIAGHQMITLDNGDVFISLSRSAGVSTEIQILKKWRWVK